MSDRKGWLQEQLSYAKSQTEDWPTWKKEAIYNQNSHEVSSNIDNSSTHNTHTVDKPKLCV